MEKKYTEAQQKIADLLKIKKPREYTMEEFNEYFKKIYEPIIKEFMTNVSTPSLFQPPKGATERSKRKKKGIKK